MKFNKWFYLICGFILVKIILLSIFVGLAPGISVNEISYAEAVELIETKKVKELRIDNDLAKLIQSENTEYSLKLNELQKSTLLDKSLKYKITTFLEPANTPIFSAESNLLAYLFQILFLLFIISPPIIVVLLICILKELKKRNDLK